ncbi:MAG: hypothetical protein FWE96_05425 [Coriobacteriia bacterium]|nr:hypothetical protein [Coriobacteriia bacterium]
MFQFDLGQIGTLTPSPCSTNLGHQPRPSCTRFFFCGTQQQLSASQNTVYI